MQKSLPPDWLDQNRFRRLLDLIGPADAGAFLAQLAQDLSGCAETIARCSDTEADRRDWDALRGASHVLVSLAGSVGATSLHALAERLNQAAHDRDVAALAQLRPQLTREQAALLDFVRAAPAPMATPR